MRKTVSMSGLSLGNEDQRIYQNHGTAVTMRGIWEKAAKQLSNVTVSVLVTA